MFIALMTFIVIRLSISCMFWLSNNPKNKRHVFKTYFPYYIITFFALFIVIILEFDKSIFAFIYCGSVYSMILLVWRFKLKIQKKNLQK